MILVLGNGKIGRCIVDAFMYLGYPVRTVDLKNAGYADYEICLQNEVEKFKALLSTLKPSFVVSTLPFYLNLEVAKICIHNGIAYTDLGGNNSVSGKINLYAEKNALNYVITDLGLAPGYVNILAEHAFLQLKDVESIVIRAGGLPIDFNPENLLNYSLTWSIEGLINEYTDECLVIQDNKIESVAALDGLDNIDIQGLQFESFFTSGGISHTLTDMLDRGVKNCSYKTIRWPGHRNIIKSMLDVLELEEIKDILTLSSSECKDMVLIQCVASSPSNYTYYNNESLVLSSDKYTEMQRATAFPVVATIVELLKQNNEIPRKKITYKELGGCLDNINDTILKLL